MFKYNLAMILLGVFVLITILISFSIMGSPFSQQDIKKDQQRYQDFSTIRSAVQSYFSANNRLPDSIASLNERYSYANKTDPESKKPYGYKVLGPVKYQLCANFSFDSRNARYKSIFGKYSTDIPYQHKKGYDCLTLTLPQSLKNESNKYLFETPTPTPTQIVAYWQFEPGYNYQLSSNSARTTAKVVFQKTQEESDGFPIVLKNVDVIQDGRKAIHFKGDRDGYAINLNNRFLYDILQDNFTISLWVNRHSTGNNVLLGNSNYYDGGFSLLVGAEGEIYCRTSDGDTYNDTYTDTDGKYILPYNGWHHIVVERNQHICHIYVDGEDRTTTYADNGTISENENSFTFGQTPDGSEVFEGYLSDIEINNYDLTPAEVKEKYQKQK